VLEERDRSLRHDRFVRSHDRASAEEERRGSFIGAPTRCERRAGFLLRSSLHQGAAVSLTLAAVHARAFRPCCRLAADGDAGRRCAEGQELHESDAGREQDRAASKSERVCARSYGKWSRARV
jgi:hypothetical protein